MTLYAMYRKNKPVQDQKLPEHKGDIIENVVVAVVTDEKKQEVSVPQPGDIENIGEKKEEKQDDQQQPEEKKKQDQVVANDKTEHNNNNVNINNINNSNNKNETGEREENCEV